MRPISIYTIALLLALPLPGFAFEQNESPLRSTLLQGQNLQSVALTVLLFVFIGITTLVFRRYRRKKNLRVATFTETLSDQVGSDKSFAFAPAVSSESSPAVLVAQMDVDRRLFITNILRLNYRVIATSDGEDAFEKAYELVPDLIISDIHLPVTNGFALTRRLKGAEATSHIPVILLDTSNENVKRSSYADDYITGGFDARELLLRVHGLLNKRKELYLLYRNQLVDDDNAESDLQEHHFLFKIKRVLRMYYSDPGFGVEQLTDQLHMSRLQLVRKLRALMLLSPAELIRFYRLEQSKKLLQEKGSTAVDAAFKTGFTNPALFHRAFRESTGMTPEEFAAQSKKKSLRSMQNL